MEFSFWSDVVNTAVYGVVAVQFWVRTFDPNRDRLFNFCLFLHFIVIVIRNGFLVSIPDTENLNWSIIHRTTIFLPATIPFAWLGIKRLKNELEKNELEK